MSENKKETLVEKRDRMMAGAVEMMADLKKNDSSLGKASLVEVMIGHLFLPGGGRTEGETITEETEQDKDIADEGTAVVTDLRVPVDITVNGSTIPVTVSLGFSYDRFLERVDLERRRATLKKRIKPTTEELKAQVKEQRWGFWDQSYDYSLADFLEYEGKLCRAL